MEVWPLMRPREVKQEKEFIEAYKNDLLTKFMDSNPFSNNYYEEIDFTNCESLRKDPDFDVELCDFNY